MDQPQRCRAHWGRCPHDATTGARGRDDVDVTMIAVYTGRWRPAVFLSFISSESRRCHSRVSVLWWIVQPQITCHTCDLCRFIYFLWPQGVRGLWLRGCYSYLFSPTSVVSMSFARPVYVPVSERGWTRARA